jgi:hypothetical protein
MPHWRYHLGAVQPAALEHPMSLPVRFLTQPLDECAFARGEAPG